MAGHGNGNGYTTPAAMTAGLDARTVNKLAMLQAMPHNPVNAIDALEALVKYDGDVILAASDLDTSPNMVMAALVGNDQSHDLLARYLRAYTMAKTFGIINQLVEVVSESMSDMSPKDAAATLTKLIEGMAKLTQVAPAPPSDPYALLMRLLPAPQREAMQALAAQAGTPDEIIQQATHTGISDD